MPLQFFERTDYHLHNVYRQILTELRVHKILFRNFFDLRTQRKEICTIAVLRTLYDNTQIVMKPRKL